ncbi:hypothetical protein J6590_095176 [Homalodisca vitripennis]|nr:hypothetical protein J6590_095176 [Homalodisca vitripennis]
MAERKEPIAERSKTLDFKLLEIAQVQILSAIVAILINLVLHRLSSFCFIRSSHSPVAHEDGQSKVYKGIGLSLKTGLSTILL